MPENNNDLERTEINELLTLVQDKNYQQAVLSLNDLFSKPRSATNYFTKQSIFQALQALKDKHIDKTKCELINLFQGVEFESKFNEWLRLFNDDLIIAANNKLRKWMVEAKNAPTALSLTDFKGYYDLCDDSVNLGIRLQGATELGAVGIQSVVFGTSRLSLEAIEIIDVDSQHSDYFVDITITKDKNFSSSRLPFDEIDRIVMAIGKMISINTSITKLESYTARVATEDGFSLAVSTLTGKTYTEIATSSLTCIADGVGVLSEIKNILNKGKDYIFNNTQDIGVIGFRSKQESKQASEEYNTRIPELVSERLTPYLATLSRKYHQLTYTDEYNTLELGGFYNEIDRFINKVIPELDESQRKLAKEIIFDIVSAHAVTTECDLEFNSSMEPVDYELGCARLFQKYGWQTRRTPRTGDQGADILISSSDGIYGVVQCKLYSKPVGNGAVQEVIAAKEYYKTDISVVVTNTTFTISARQLAESANVVLLNHEDIEQFSLKFIL